MSNNDTGKIKKIGNVLIDGFKKSMSSSLSGSSTVKYIKQRSFDVYSGVYDVFSIICTSFAIIFYYLLWLFRVTKKLPYAFKSAAQNNFKLGLDALKKNNLIDARIRFLLSNLFYRKSSLTKYYIAYIYFLQRNFSKSLKYLRQSISLNSKNKKALKLLQDIETELKKS